MGFTPKEFPSFWPLPLKNSTTFIPYPWRIPLFLNQGDADIKWNSPFRLTNLFLLSTKVQVLFYSDLYWFAWLLIIIALWIVSQTRREGVHRKCITWLGINWSGMWLSLTPYRFKALWFWTCKQSDVIFSVMSSSPSKILWPAGSHNNPDKWYIFRFCYF